MRHRSSMTRLLPLVLRYALRTWRWMKMGSIFSWLSFIIISYGNVRSKHFGRGEELQPSSCTWLRRKSENPTGTALHLGQTSLSIKSSSTPDNCVTLTALRRGREPEMAADCWGLYNKPPWGWMTHVKKPCLRQMSIASMSALALTFHLKRTVYGCRIELSSTGFL